MDGARLSGCLRSSRPGASSRSATKSAWSARWETRPPPPALMRLPPPRRLPPRPVRFAIVHEFDIPLDALELAVISPTLVDRLVAMLQKRNIERLEQKSFSLTNGVLDRVWHYQAKAPIPAFAKKVMTKEM